MRKKRILKKFALFLSLFMFTTMQLAGQEIQIKGKITDAGTNETLPGVNIIIKGTTTGSVSNLDGEYTISASAGQVLVFSFLGYASKEIIVTSSASIINVAMEASVTGLDEVVVIGYGTVKKADATGSVSVVSSKDFNKGAMTSPQDLVVGKTAGVVITSNSGAPGSGSTIRIRGGSSLRASNDPLVVIDGVPLDNTGINGLSNPLATINPNDIETFTVLKDASATAIYGSRASNGVIIITTKKGSEGQRLKIEYNANTSVSYLPKTIDVFSGDEYRKLASDLITQGKAPGFNTDELKLLGTANTDWQKEIYQAALSQDHNLNFSGSKYKVPYRVSVGYTNQDGVLKHSNVDRKTAAIALTPKVLDDHLKVDLNWKYTQTKSNFSNTGAIGSALSYDPTQPVMNGNTRWGGYTTWINSSDKDKLNGTPNSIASSNPVALINQTDDRSTVKRHIGNIQLDYRFHFLPDLRANLNLAYDYSNSDGHNNKDTTAAFTYRDGLGSKRVYSQALKNELLDFYLNYTKDIKVLESRIDFTTGYSYQYFYREDPSVNQNLKAPIKIDSLGSKSENLIISFFGRMNYTLLDRYLLTFTLRDDGSSRFSPDTRWGIFPAAAFAWKINNEQFLENATFITDLKLRLGWGVTGQQDIPGGYYPYIAIYQSSTPSAQYLFGNKYYNTQRPNPYDALIKWEETTTSNIGFDFGFLKNRITGSADYYFRETKDMIGETPIPAGTNFSNYLITNVGNLENKGYEISLDAKIISTKDWLWEIGYNIAYNENKITKLKKVVDPTDPGVASGNQISGGVGNRVQIWSVGYPNNSFFVFQQVYDKNGMPIEGLYVDRSGKGGNITGNNLNKYHYNKPDPDYTMGINTRVSYKNLDFSMSGRINLGNYVYNNLASTSTYSAMHGSTHFFNNLPKLVNDTKFSNTQYWSDAYIENASFFRMDNISLGYTFNRLLNNKVGLRLGLTVQNAFVITNYKGLDPEVDGGIDNNIYPRPRVYLLALSLDF